MCQSNGSSDKRYETPKCRGREHDSEGLGEKDANDDAELVEHADTTLDSLGGDLGQIGGDDAETEA